MKILSGINTVDEFQAICDAGADELYCGIFQKNEFSHGNSTLNRREGLLFNLAGHQEFERLSSLAQRRNVPVFLALNSFYSQPSFEKVKAQINTVLPLEPAGFIVADISVLRYLKDIGYQGKIAISVGGTAFNTEAVLFYQELGASRIILPRHFTVEELSAFRGSPVELEMILLEDRCQFIDGFCNFYHFYPTKSFLGFISNRFLARRIFPFMLQAQLRKKSSFVYSLLALLQKLIRWIFRRQTNLLRRACSIRYTIHPLAVQGQNHHQDEYVHKISELLSENTVLGTCGLCQLPLLKAIGIGYLKIANRGKTTTQKVQTITLARSAIDAMERIDSTADYMTHIKECYQRIYCYPCTQCHCYFPEE